MLFENNSNNKTEFRFRTGWGKGDKEEHAQGCIMYILLKKNHPPPPSFKIIFSPEVRYFLRVLLTIFGENIIFLDKKDKKLHFQNSYY